ncbi:hypothetical protein J3Q64DRAFT_1609095, partial [Phycomyces blakesleeanus]
LILMFKLLVTIHNDYNENGEIFIDSIEGLLTAITDLNIFICTITSQTAYLTVKPEYKEDT